MSIAEGAATYLAAETRKGRAFPNANATDQKCREQGRVIPRSLLLPLSIVTFQTTVSLNGNKVHQRVL